MVGDSLEYEMKKSNFKLKISSKIRVLFEIIFLSYLKHLSNGEIRKSLVYFHVTDTIRWLIS